MDQKICRQEKITYLDFYSHMVDNQNGLKTEYSEDGVHPNKKGYLVMEPLTEEAITTALKHK